MIQPETISETHAKPFRTALVSMPFADANKPSIQIGLLHAILQQKGFASQTFHLYLDFAARIGVRLYRSLARYRGPQFGEWLFSSAAFGESTPPKANLFLQDFAQSLSFLDAVKCDASRLERARLEIVPTFLRDMLEAIDWSSFAVVGFTSTFQQNVASFALAGQIKDRFPHVKIVFGGANFDGEMGYEWIRAMPFIDFAVTGEADHSFLALLAAIQSGSPTDKLKGVISRTADGHLITGPRAESVVELNQSPTPDYDEYFERRESLGLDSVSAAGPVIIPFESSRGCWWGQKNHCTFCGLNGETMRFRSRAPDQVLRELQLQAARHGSFSFAAVDNIMDNGYFATLLDKLKDAPTTFKLFYEIKSNITRRQVKRLAEAGVVRIQPGIESLNSRILKLMRKGVRGIQNVNLLRWAMYYGLNVSWNLLWVFPGETRADYEQQLDLIRRLLHLQRPAAAGRIHMDRFSPLFSDRASYPADFLRPESSYAYIYPENIDLFRAAYFFDYQLQNVLDDPIFDETTRAVADWENAWRRADKPSLIFWYAPGLVKIDDRRFGEPTTFELTGDLAEIYLAASDAPMTAERLQTKLQENANADIDKILATMCEARIMMQEQDLYLSLALPATPNR